MTGQASWLSLGFALFGMGSIIGLLVWSFFDDRKYRTEARRHLCPQTGLDAQTVHVRDARTGEWLGVQTCSLWRDPEVGTCAHDCVKELKARSADLVLLEVRP